MTTLAEQDSVNLPEELLSVLLHDLRSPLGAVSVLVELLSTVSKDETMAIDPRQLLLLQEASVKAQRMLDDAVEIQSVVRGSSTFSFAPTKLSSLVGVCLEKARQALYFQDVDVTYDYTESAGQEVTIDVEKAEIAILCVLEQAVAHTPRPISLKIHQSVEAHYVNLHIVNETIALTNAGELVAAPIRQAIPLRGRLGSRRVGESRYSFQVARKVMGLMGGNIEQQPDQNGSAIVMKFPIAPG